jgi:hypothetical protein
MRKKGYIRFRTWENEEFVKCSNEKAMERWIKEWSGYDSVEDFRERTGFDYRKLVGIWFFICGRDHVITR